MDKKGKSVHHAWENGLITISLPSQQQPFAFHTWTTARMWLTDLEGIVTQLDFIDDNEDVKPERMYRVLEMAYRMKRKWNDSVPSKMVKQIGRLEERLHMPSFQLKRRKMAPVSDFIGKCISCGGEYRGAGNETKEGVCCDVCYNMKIPVDVVEG